MAPDCSRGRTKGCLDCFVSAAIRCHNPARRQRPHGCRAARAVRRLTATPRTVTLTDYESVALATPGVPVARTHAIADCHPRLGRVPVSGSVTIVVLPSCLERRPEACMSPVVSANTGV
jgi:hypothetical protein